MSGMFKYSSVLIWVLKSVDILVLTKFLVELVYTSCVLKSRLTPTGSFNPLREFLKPSCNKFLNKFICIFLPTFHLNCLKSSKYYLIPILLFVTKYFATIFLHAWVKMSVSPINKLSFEWAHWPLNKISWVYFIFPSTLISTIFNLLIFSS